MIDLVNIIHRDISADVRCLIHHRIAALGDHPWRRIITLFVNANKLQSGLFLQLLTFFFDFCVVEVAETQPV